MSVLSWSHVRSCKLIRWRCILQCFFAWSVAVLLVLSREWMGLGVAGMIITSDYGSFPHSLLSTSKLQCICVFVAVQVWRYDTILPGITSQRMLHGSMERHWRLGWYHVLSRCLDHVFSVCILQWLTCKIIMNCFVGYHEVSSPWFPKPSWLCYHRHIRLSDGLPHDPKVTIGPWSLESFAPGTRDTRGGAGRHRKSARIALLPLPSLLTHFDAESESLRATKEKLQEFGGKSLILMILIFAYFCHFGYTYISLGGVLKMDHVETAALYI